MPILVPVGPDAPLDQGDVLENIVTALGGHDVAANVAGPVLVISRPCNANVDKQIIVAPIAKCDLAALAELETFKDFLDFFKALRDGEGRPDTFYLGEMAGGSKERYVAKFDVLHTIRVPVGDDARRQFLVEHRRVRLASDFQRDLHQRLFRAFASLGFDDERWWTDEDLKVLVEKGKALHQEQLAGVDAARAELTTLQMASGERKGENKTKDNVKQAEKEAAETKALLEPLLTEHARRFSS
jgi:hypothetical protein